MRERPYMGERGVGSRITKLRLSVYRKGVRRRRQESPVCREACAAGPIHGEGGRVRSPPGDASVRSSHGSAHVLCPVQAGASG
jgi:hypothetical protein